MCTFMPMENWRNGQVLCETDFVARSDDFRNFVRDLALHVASENPLYLTLEDVPASVLEKKKQLLLNNSKMRKTRSNV